jgi:hypothetical protein
MKKKNLFDVNSFFTVMSITKAKFKNEEYSAIASSYYLLAPTSFSLYYQTMFNRLKSFYTNEKLNIIIVSEKIERFQTHNIGEDLNCIYTINQMPTTEFFEQSFIENIILNDNINNTIFIFYNLKYRSIIDSFALLKVRISGGSSSKKHTLSPVQLRLARFIFTISDFDSTAIADSFYFEKNKQELNLVSEEANLEFNQTTEKIRNNIIHQKNSNSNSNSNSNGNSNSPVENTNKVLNNKYGVLLSKNKTLSRRGLHTWSVFKKDDNTTIVRTESNTNPIRDYS